VSCEPGPFAEGEVRVGQAACDEALVGNGEGRTVETRLANAWLNAFVRHPQESVTLPGSGGGTLVDAAPWGYRDRLHEVVPIVGGGWLDVDGYEVIDDEAVLVSGTVRPILGRPAAEEGQRREIVWTIDPDGPWLQAEGAEGLYIHVSEGAELLDGQLWVGAAMYGHDGDDVEDFGGAVIAHGASRLLVAPATTAASWLPGPQQPLAGEAAGAERIVLLRGGERVGYVIPVEGAFDLAVPADVDGLYAEAEGRLPSPTIAPGRGLTLEIGPAGSVRLDVQDVGGPVVARWSAGGRSGETVVLPPGGFVPTGPGTVELWLSAGPAFGRRHLRVDVPADGEIPVPVDLREVFDPGDRVLAALPWTASRSRDWRGTDRDALDAALAEGVGYAVLAPEGEVGGGEAGDEAPWLRFRTGSTLRSPDGWSVLAWPWSPSSRRAGHGAVEAEGLSPAEALALSAAGTASNRFLAVDLAWLEAAGAPFELHAPPDVVRLDHPGDDPSAAWAPWFRWLDAARPLSPVGPYAWVDVDDATAYGAVDVERGLLLGRSAATTGPLLVLDVNGVGPGEVVTQPGRRLRAHVSLPSGELPHTALIGEGGRVLGAWDGASATITVEEPGRYVVAVAWSDTGFVAAGPVWIEAP
jgi:hypothetical protein